MYNPSAYATNRVTLWPMTRRFEQELMTLNSDPIVMKHFNGFYSKAENLAKIHESEQHWLTYGFGLWCWLDKTNNDFIGRGGLRYQTLDDGSLLLELAYMMHHRYWGKGLASEVMQYALYLGFNVFGFNEIHAVTTAQNNASQNVMKRLGMTFKKEYVLFRGLPHLTASIHRKKWQ